MNREEFCEILKNKRESKGISKNETARRIGVLFRFVNNIEKATHSFNMKKILTYISVIDSILIIDNNRIDTYEDLLCLFKKERKKIGTKLNFAKTCSMTHVMVGNIESSKSLMSLDVLLNMCSSLSLKIDIVDKEHTTTPED